MKVNPTVILILFMLSSLEEFGEITRNTALWRLDTGAANSWHTFPRMPWMLPFVCMQWLVQSLRRLGKCLLRSRIAGACDGSVCGSGAWSTLYAFWFCQSVQETLCGRFGRPIEILFKKNHRYNARKSMKNLDFEICDQPAQYIGEWTRLYENLIEKHHIKNISTFSRKCFELQLNVPGTLWFLAGWKEKSSEDHSSWLAIK